LKEDGLIGNFVITLDGNDNIGEVAELAEGARLLSECRVKSSTEGSNPSLSAALKWRRGRVWLNALVLKTSEGFALQRFESSRLRNCHFA
tara:strand:- start:5529 stop:5798 length:270 start_codon:yes stop_codon:yes gene_type:complete